MGLSGPGAAGRVFGVLLSVGLVGVGAVVLGLVAVAVGWCLGGVANDEGGQLGAGRGGGHRGDDLGDRVEDLLGHHAVRRVDDPDGSDGIPVGVQDVDEAGRGPFVHERLDDEVEAVTRVVLLLDPGGAIYGHGGMVAVQRRELGDACVVPGQDLGASPQDVEHVALVGLAEPCAANGVVLVGCARVEDDGLGRDALLLDEGDEGLPEVAQEALDPTVLPSLVEDDESDDEEDEPDGDAVFHDKPSFEVALVVRTIPFLLISRV